MNRLESGYRLVSDQALIDPVATHAYLTRSYWAAGIPFETVARSIKHSICAEVFWGEDQVAFARVISDRATFAYLADVYVLEDHRRKALSHALLDHFDSHSELQNLRRWALFTLDAQALYRQHGWQEYPHPERMMTRDKPDIYR